MAEVGRKQFVRWYLGRGRVCLWDKVREHAPSLQMSSPGVSFQELGYRRGSCGRGGWLYFHWKNMLLPRTIAEYAVVRALVHLHTPHHTPEFWRRLERATGVRQLGA